MAICTAAVVAILIYLIDALPERVDRIFAAAKARETAIQKNAFGITELDEPFVPDGDDRPTGSTPGTDASLSLGA